LSISSPHHADQSNNMLDDCTNHPVLPLIVATSSRVRVKSSSVTRYSESKQTCIRVPCHHHHNIAMITIRVTVTASRRIGSKRPTGPDFLAHKTTAGVEKMMTAPLVLASRRGKSADNEFGRNLSSRVTVHVRPNACRRQPKRHLSLHCRYPRRQQMYLRNWLWWLCKSLDGTFADFTPTRHPPLQRLARECTRLSGR
jgi:hypothetical protein